jgi:hypothetical protein
MRLDRAEGTTPAWMVSAVRARYGNTELVRIERYGGGRATVVVRSATSEKPPTEGDQLVPFAETLQVPGEALPTGIVEQVSEVELVQGGPEESIDSGASSGQKVALRLLASAGLLLAVVFLARKVQPK